MLKLKVVLIAIIISVSSVFVGCAVQQPVPPDAAKIPVKTEIHDDVLIDNYAWLRDKENPQVINYLEKENKYTQLIMKDTKKLQKKLFKEFVERIDQTDLTVPVKKEDYYYYSKTEEGKQYRIFCRKKGSLEAEEEILLDVNKIAKKYDYVGIGTYSVSPNHNILAYSLDTTGAEEYTVFFKDLVSGEYLPDKLGNSDGDALWGNDNKTVFYTVHNDIGLPYKVFRHVLGTEPSGDELVFHEKDKTYYLYTSKTRSGKYIMLFSGSGTTNEVRIIDADNPLSMPVVIHPRQKGLEYYVAHHSDRFYILYNENAENFKLAYAPVENPSKANWVDIIDHRDNVLLNDVELFKNYMVLHERIEGQQQLRIININDNNEHYISFPETLFSVNTGPNPEFDSNTLRLSYDSMVTPYTVLEYNMESREMKELKKMKVHGGYFPADYVTERVFAPSHDGKVIPICLLYRKGMKRDGTNPVILDGYGAYGSMSDPYFSSLRVSLVDRGFVYAVAQVRGGGEMGRSWYNDGKMFNKKNSFKDFISCAEYLIKEKYTTPKKLAAYGGSAGGLLMGAVVNMRPDLFGAVIADVPFVDVINTMLDDTIPLTTYEYEEWGNPNDKKSYEYMKSYSPYDNVEDKCYPNMLIEAGLNDPRVGYWEPAKWTAKLRDHNSCDNMLIFRTDMTSGHGGPSGSYDFYKVIAFQYAFYIKALGLELN